MTGRELKKKLALVFESELDSKVVIWDEGSWQWEEITSIKVETIKNAFDDSTKKEIRITT